ncbi:N/A [soil metagenome]
MTRAILIAVLAGLAAPVASFATPSHKAVTPPEAVAAAEYLFAERGVFEIVAAPGRITDIILEPGESLVETNPIAAGDTLRWVIGDTTSGEGSARRVHVLVKPVQAGLSTNLIINTTRRSYHLQMRASARTFLSQVAWRYPKTTNPALLALAQPPLVAAAPTPQVPERLNLDYRIKGQARWRPARVFDNGARTFVEFRPDLAMADLPPLYVLGLDGKSSELVNYRVEGRRLVVDRLFDRAELRFGLKRWERRVRIERTPHGREIAR